jgi:hypothetical protein
MFLAFVKFRYQIQNQPANTLNRDRNQFNQLLPDILAYRLQNQWSPSVVREIELMKT